MIRSRHKPKIKRSPAPLSDDRFDKFVAAMNWHVGRNKSDPEYSRAPHYYGAVSEWFDRLSLDDQECVYTVVHVYTTPAYGGAAVAVTYAASLPPVPSPPDVVRRAWGHD